MEQGFESFQSKFVDEATDNINELEQTLLELELAPANRNLVEKVFRVMHSLKGGGAMFGFEQLSEFTHRLENIYELVRNGQLAVTPDLLSVTLNSVDLLRELLDVNHKALPGFATRYQRMVNAIDELLREETQKRLAGLSGQVVTSNPAGTEPKMGTYYIHFYPGADTLRNGTNLLYLIDDLNSMGNLLAIAGNSPVPSLDDLDPEGSYMYWDLFLATDQGQEAIRDVFIFVEAESVLEIHRISGNNLVANEQFVSHLNSLKHEQQQFELSDISGFLSNTGGAGSLPPGLPSEEAVLADPGKEEQRNRAVSSIRVSSEKIEALMNLVSEMVINQERLNMVAAHHQIPELKMVTENIQKLTGALRDNALSISLIPVESLLTRFQRLVRDLSGELGKHVTFSAIGAETELDKTMIESLTDPLLHIIRNSIDHGIEEPELRQKKGKDPVGTIALEAAYSGANVVITIKDDGAGIDPQSLKEKALEKGLIANDADLTPQEILNLVFVPGFSTSNSITEVSGRGVGMDVVKRNIMAIRGEVDIESEYGRGTTITITLPMVLSIIDGLLVRINESQYIIPLSLTNKIYPVNSQQLNRSFVNLITLEGVEMPFINLRQELNLKGKPSLKSQMVVVNHGREQVALAVDQVMGKMQAVLKPLGRLYHNQKAVSAATIMGDGSIALVFDTNYIIKELLN